VSKFSKLSHFLIFSESLLLLKMRLQKQIHV